jgi:hypothetical protein
VAKRIEPLSSRAHIVDKKPVDVEPATTLPQPRNIKPSRRSRETPVKKKKSFWRRLWFAIQIGLIMMIVAGSILAYFVYEKALVYYARAETYDL